MLGKDTEDDAGTASPRPPDEQTGTPSPASSHTWRQYEDNEILSMTPTRARQTLVRVKRRLHTLEHTVDTLEHTMADVRRELVAEKDTRLRIIDMITPPRVETLRQRHQQLRLITSSSTMHHGTLHLPAYAQELAPMLKQSSMARRAHSGRQ